MISVVIPVYNVEKYLKECLESVINQTYKELEIILVDDGSTDNSGKICDEYAEIDPRIKVVHQKNMGAGGAKNTGLDLISGDYFSIIDSDDYLELNYYETLLNSMIKYQVDVVQCLHRDFYVDGIYNRSYSFDRLNRRNATVLSRKKFLFELLYDWKYAVFWNKLFKVSLLNDIRFPVGRKIDDEFFTYKLICNSNRILNVNDVLYNYRRRKSSVMNSNIKCDLVLDRIDCFEERLQYIEEYEPKLYDVYYDHLANYLIYSLKEFSESDKSIPQQLFRQYPIKNKRIYEKIINHMIFKNYFNDFQDLADKEKYE